MGANKQKKPQKKPVLSSRKTKKGAALATWKLLDNCSTLAKHHGKHHGPTHTSKHFQLHQDVMRHPNSPNPSNGYASEKTRQRAGTCIPARHTTGDPSHPCRVSGAHTGSDTTGTLTSLVPSSQGGIRGDQVRSQDSHHHSAIMRSTP